MSTQKKVTEEIKKLAAKHKVDADFEFNYSNDGRVYFRKGFKTIANLSFSFQGDRATFALKSGSVKAEYFGESDKIFLIDYGNEADFINLFASIVFAIKRGK